MNDDLDTLLRYARWAARKYRGTSLGYEDALGVSYLAVMEAMRSYDSDRGVPLSAYTATKVRWALSEAARRVRGKKNHPDWETPVEDDFFDEKITTHDDYHLVHDVVMALRPRVREVVLLVASGWTNREVARRFGVDPTRISQHLAEARITLTRALQLRAAA